MYQATEIANWSGVACVAIFVSGYGTFLDGEISRFQMRSDRMEAEVNDERNRKRWHRARSVRYLVLICPSSVCPGELGGMPNSLTDMAEWDGVALYNSLLS